MPLFLLPIWAMLKASVLPTLFALPKWVWYGLAGLIAFMYVLHWYGGKIKAEQQLVIERTTNKEVKRQTQVAETEVEKAYRLAAENERKLQIVTGELDNAKAELAKWKSTGNVCLPSTFTDQLRKRAIRNRRSP